MQLQLTGPKVKGTLRLMLSLPAQAQAQTRLFDLGQLVTGPIELRLVFLPGASLSLHSLRFLKAE